MQLLLLHVGLLICLMSFLLDAPHCLLPRSFVHLRIFRDIQLALLCRNTLDLPAPSHVRHLSFQYAVAVRFDQTTVLI
jgi:hypothetical protein